MNSWTANVLFLCMAVCITSACLCSHVGIVGGGTEDVNTMVVTGTVTNPDGTPASGAQVLLIAANFDPVRSSRDTIPTTSTDESGGYAFTLNKYETYNIQIVQVKTRTRALVRRLAGSGALTVFPPAKLSEPGSVKIMVSAGSNAANGYYYIPGTTIFAYLKHNSGYVLLDSVPEIEATDILYSVAASQVATVLRYNVAILPGKTVLIFNPGWNHCRALTLNTAASGANVGGDVAGFPALIRLSKGYFDFSQARNGGEDLRFAKSDNTFLPYEIERWDPAAGVAEVWVKVDTVRGNDSTQSLTMYWGNIDASAQSNSSAVFDTANGFQGVWHLSEAARAIAKDATGNQYDGTPSDTAPAAAEGMIGPCRSFNGSSNYIRMNNTATGKLNFQENGIYTISAWAYADTLDIGYHMVAGKNNEQYFLGLKRSQPDTTMRWEFVEYHDKAGWQITQDFPSAKTWAYLVGIRKGTTQYLYVNGALADSTIEVTPNNASRNAGDDVTIGRFLSAPVFAYEGKCPFLGKIDEVRISNVNYSADWIRLCYMNQKTSDALVKW